MDSKLSNLLQQRKAGANNIDSINKRVAEIAYDGFNVRDLQEVDILKVINGSYIATRFFNRSASWFSQKLNHHVKNGKPCDFTDEERKQLKRALDTIAWEIQELADNM